MSPQELFRIERAKRPPTITPDILSACQRAMGEHGTHFASRAGRQPSPIFAQPGASERFTTLWLDPSMRIEEMGRQFNVSGATIRNHAIRLGLPIKPVPNNGDILESLRRGPKTVEAIAQSVKRLARNIRECLYRMEEEGIVQSVQGPPAPALGKRKSGGQRARIYSLAGTKGRDASYSTA